MVHSLAAGHDNMVCCERRHQGKTTAGPLFPVRHPCVIGSACHQPWTGADSGDASRAPGTAILRAGARCSPRRNDAVTSRRQRIGRCRFRFGASGPAAHCDIADNPGPGSDRTGSEPVTIRHSHCHPIGRPRRCRGFSFWAGSRVERQQQPAPHGCGSGRRRDGTPAGSRRHRPAGSGVFACYGRGGTCTRTAGTCRSCIGTCVCGFMPGSGNPLRIG